jgi:hypothetical protein
VVEVLELQTGEDQEEDFLVFLEIHLLMLTLFS